MTATGGMLAVLQQVADDKAPAGSRVLALSRLCRALDEGLLSDDGLDQLNKAARAQLVIGLTGAPGVGKSSLASALVTELRKRGQRVAVLCVDPTSPFSGGAILGDRIRMQEHTSDSEVFIRSVATRGALGGLTRSTSDMVCAMSLWGAEVIVIETVGVGQDELDIMLEADCCVVVLAPGLGDDVQAAKAGILEIADVLVVNKADQPRAAQTVSDLRAMLSMRQAFNAQTVGHGTISHGTVSHTPSGSGDQQTPASEIKVLETVATQRLGLDALLREIDAKKQWLTDTEQGRAQAQAQRLQRARQRLLVELSVYVQSSLSEELTSAAEQIVNGLELSKALRLLRQKLDPRGAA